MSHVNNTTQVLCLPYSALPNAEGQGGGTSLLTCYGVRITTSERKQPGVQRSTRHPTPELRGMLPDHLVSPARAGSSDPRPSHFSQYIVSNSPVPANLIDTNPRLRGSSDRCVMSSYYFCVYLLCGVGSGLSCQ
jgi:hypothetical protein